jgi:hypothetical protein
MDGISQENQLRISQHQEMQKNYELRVKAEKYPIPTNWLMVRARLR